MKSFHYLAWTAIAALACGCSQDPPPGGGAQNAATANSAAETSAGGANEIVAVRARAEEFFAAANSAEEARIKPLLTLKAREALATADGHMFNSPKVATATYGQPKIDGDTALAPLNVTEGGNEETVTLLFRKEEGEWRVHGLRMPSPFEPGGEFTLDFEAPQEALSGALEGMVEGLAEGMQESLEQAFSPENIAARAAEEGRAKARQIMDLESIAAADFEESWQVDFETDGRPGGEVLDDLAARLGVVIDRTAADAAGLAEPLSIDLQGRSLLEALEETAAAVGSHPEYPDPNGGGGLFGQPATDEPPTIVLEAGRREQPVAFAGPFLIQVRQVHEHPPYGTGMLSLGTFAYGLSPGALKAMEDVSPLEITAVADAAGSELRDPMSGGFGMSPLLEKGSYRGVLNVALVGLVRSVSEIARVDGAVTVTLPGEVATGELVNLMPDQTVEVGGATIKLDSVAPSETSLLGEPQPGVQLGFSWKGLPAAQVQFVAIDAAGEVLPTNRLYASGFGDEASAAIDVTGEPDKIVVKAIVAQETLRYDIGLANLPLAQAADQPEAIAQATFDGEAPASIEYLELAGEENFRKLKVRIINHSDLAIRALDLRVVFLGADGQEIENSPSSHSESSDFETGRPTAVVEAGATAEAEVMAFFMPDETKDVRITVEGVQFVNSTRWQQEPSDR